VSAMLPRARYSDSKRAKSDWICACREGDKGVGKSDLTNSTSGAGRMGVLSVAVVMVGLYEVREEMREVYGG